MTIATEVRMYPKALAVGFGRVFYGAQGRVYFSQIIIDNFESLGRCYQKNDPISDVASDILDTDGGEILLQDAGNILAMEPFKSGILVFCDNGVWFISGTSDTGFTATSYMVNKISPFVLYAPRTVTPARDAVLFAGKEACYAITEAAVGQVEVTPITEGTIDSYWKSFISQETCATYDEIKKQVHFIKYGTSGSILVFDAKLSAWFPWKVTLDTPSYTFSLVGSVWNDTLKQSVYSVSDGAEVRFCSQDGTLYDFEPTGVYNSYLWTQPETFGNYTRFKGVPLIQAFFRRTESNITDFVDNSYTYDNPSSCTMTIKFDWDTTKSTVPRQIYKALPPRFVPPTVPYTLPFGNEMVVFKDKIRGKGRSVQVKFESVGNNKMDIYGFSLQYTTKATA